MNWKKFLAQAAAGLALSFCVMCWRGLFDPSAGAPGRLMAVSDGFTVTAFLYLCVSGLAWASSTGVFDIFGYAFRKGAHAVIPGLAHDKAGSYYDYKMKKNDGRKSFAGKTAVWTGLLFLAAAVIITAAWYAAAG